MSREYTQRIEPTEADPDSSRKGNIEGVVVHFGDCGEAAIHGENIRENGLNLGVTDNLKRKQDIIDRERSPIREAQPASKMKRIRAPVLGFPTRSQRGLQFLRHSIDVQQIGR